MIGDPRAVPFSPAEPFRFCPADGTRLVEPRQSGARCPKCGRSWYRNSAPAVGCVIVRDGCALVTVRAREPEKDRVDIPGGFLEPGEHPIDGLLREVREELSVTIEDVSGPLLMATHTYGEDGPFVLALCFTARLAGGEPEPADDAAALMWVTAEEIDDLDFAWEHDRRLVRLALAEQPRETGGSRGDDGRLA